MHPPAEREKIPPLRQFDLQLGIDWEQRLPVPNVSFGLQKTAKPASAVGHAHPSPLYVGFYKLSTRIHIWL